MDLYRAKNGPDGDTFGTDSLALDIMRSRDHGLTGYVHYLKACHKRINYESPTSWEELASRFSAKVELVVGISLFVIKVTQVIFRISSCCAKLTAILRTLT